MYKEINFLKFLLKKSVKTPIYLIFEPTNRCNSNCPFCYNKKKLNKDDNELSLEEIDKITRSMDEPLINLALSGGEPFLREDLDEVIRIFNRNIGMEFLTIPTNGLASKKIEDKVVSISQFFSGKITIMFSIDEIGKKHDDIRGVEGNFDRILETYERLVELDLDNLRLGVNTCLTDKNKFRYTDIFNFVKKEMPLVETHNFSILRKTNFDQEAKPPSFDFIKKNKDELQKLALSGDFKNPKQRLMQAVRAGYYDILKKNMEAEKRTWECYGGTLAGYLNYKGELSSCERIPPIGNLRDFNYDFVQLWNSDRLSERRRKIKNKKCNCTHGCFVKFSTTFNLKKYPFLLKYVIR